MTTNTATDTFEAIAASSIKHQDENILVAHLAATAASLAALAALMEARFGKEARAKRSSTPSTTLHPVDSRESDLFDRAVPALPAARIDGTKPRGVATLPDVAPPVIVQVYVAGCAGLRQISRNLSREYGPSPATSSCYKIGVVTRARARVDTADDDLAGRINALGADRYGAIIVDAWGGARLVDGHAAWRLCALRVKTPPSDPRITVRPRCLEIALPAGTSARAFDALLRRALLPFALHETFPFESRHTNYNDLGKDRSRDLARELYVGIDPISGGDILVSAVERALAALGKGGSILPRNRMRAGRHHPDLSGEMTPAHRTRFITGQREPTRARVRKPMSAAQRGAMHARQRAENGRRRGT